MISHVEIRNPQGDILDLVLGDISNGYVVQNIDGLDPVKATIVSSSYAQVDGTQYHSSRRESRNIVFTLGLRPDYITTSVRDLRKNLYKYFMPKSQVSMRFYDDTGLVVDISGRVESLGTPFFSNDSDDPQVNISVICFDSDFIDLNTLTITGNSVSNTDVTPVTYDGTVEVGALFTLNINRTLGGFTVYNTQPDGTVVTMDFLASLVAGGSFISGDIVTVSSVTGSKFVNMMRSGAGSSILYTKSPQSGWLEFVQGVNNLRVYASGAAIPYSIAYTPRYGGL